MLFQVGTLAVLGRLLTPEDFGVVAAALVAVNFSAIFAQLGVNQALIQRSSVTEGTSGTTFLITVALGSALSLGLALLAPAIARGLALDALAPVLRALSVIFVIRAVGSTAEALLARALRFRAIALLDVVSYAVGHGAVGVTLAALGFGYWSLVGAHLAQAAVKSALAVAARPHVLRPDLDPALVRDLLTFGGGFSLSRIANFVALQADNLVVTRQLGAAAVGAYSRAYQLMGMPASLIGNALDRVLFPTFARHQTEVPALRSAYLHGTALIALACLPSGAVASVMAPELVRLLLGDQWGAVVLPFQVFSLTLVFRVGDRLNAVTARAVGAVYRRALLQAVYAVAVIVLATVGARHGLQGVATGVAAALVGNHVGGSLLALRLVGADARSAVRASLQAIPLTALAATAALFGALPGRSQSWPAPAVVAGSILLVATVSLAFLWSYPRLALGHEAPWFAALARELLPARTPGLRRWIARAEGALP